MRMMRLAMAMLVLVGGVRAQDPIKTLPKNYWVEFENAQVRVVHVHYGAGEHVPVHDHPKTPTLYVYLSDAGPVKFVHTGDDDFSLVRKPVRTGQLRMSPGREETHSVVSMSKTASDFLRVEFKTLPLHLDSMHARMPAVGEDFWTMARPEKTEFEDPHLRVVRVGVLPGQSTVLQGVVLAVRVDGALVNGKLGHSGEGWDGNVKVVAGKARVEVLRLELK
jgi:predicted metal-dependent enzyme (double-stranded beta helix superfamily)